MRAAGQALAPAALLPPVHEPGFWRKTFGTLPVIREYVSHRGLEVHPGGEPPDAGAWC